MESFEKGFVIASAIFVVLGFVMAVGNLDSQDKSTRQLLCKQLYSNSINYINCNAKNTNEIIEKVKRID